MRRLPRFWFFLVQLIFVTNGYSLNPLDTSKNIEVYFFLLEECVICQNYSTKIGELHQEFKDDFSFIR